MSDDAVFTGDGAIVKAEEDKLNRKGYAERLAKQIYAYKFPEDAKESFVIGISGEWGCGKTSLKNMVLEHLQTLPTGEDAKMDVLEFCPWEFALHRSLTEAFLYELVTHLGSDKQTEAAKKASKRLIYFSKALGFGSSMLQVASGAMTMTGNPLGLVISGVGKSGKNIAGLSAEGAAFQQIRSEKSLTETKAALQNAMMELEKPLLVVIDDLDRLNSQEIREVIHVVKTNGNLPNVIYLLLFDREIVAKALDQDTDGKGHEYLEKIIQASFNIPKAIMEDVRSYLDSKIKSFISEIPEANQWNQMAFYKMWENDSFPYLNNIRNINRFFNSLYFQTSLFKRNGFFEFSPMDLFLIEYIRFFNPIDFKKIYHSRKSLTLQRKISPDEIKKLDTEFNSVEIDIIKYLFPILEIENDTLDSKVEIKLLNSNYLDRLYNTEWFNSYFSSYIDKDQIPQYMIENAIQKINNGEGDSLKRIYEAIESDALKNKFCYALKHSSGQINPSGVYKSIEALAIFSENTEPKDSEYYINPPQLFCATSIAITILKKFLRYDEERFDTIQKILQKDPQKGILPFIARIIDASYDNTLFSNDPRFKLQRELLSIIETKQITPNRNIIFLYKGINEKQKTKNWLNDLIIKKEDALNIINELSQDGTIKLIISDIQSFIPIERIKELLENTNEEDLSNNREKKALGIWREAEARAKET